MRIQIRMANANTNTRTNTYQTFGFSKTVGFQNLAQDMFQRLASSVSGSLAPRVSGRKEVAMEPARQISIMIRYGIWIEGS